MTVATWPPEPGEPPRQRRPSPDGDWPVRDARRVVARLRSFDRYEMPRCYCGGDDQRENAAPVTIQYEDDRTDRGMPGPARVTEHGPRQPATGKQVAAGADDPRCEPRRHRRARAHPRFRRHRLPQRGSDRSFQRNEDVGPWGMPRDLRLPYTSAPALTAASLPAVSIFALGVYAVPRSSWSLAVWLPRPGSGARRILLPTVCSAGDAAMIAQGRHVHPRLGLLDRLVRRLRRPNRPRRGSCVESSVGIQHGPEATTWPRSRLRLL